MRTESEQRSEISMRREWSREMRALTSVISISYGSLAPTRSNLLQYMVTARSLVSVGPEELRNRMMQMVSTELGDSQAVQTKSFVASN